MIFFLRKPYEQRSVFAPTLHAITASVFLFAIEAYGEETLHGMNPVQSRTPFVVNVSIPGAFGLRGISQTSVNTGLANDLSQFENMSGLMLDYYPFGGDFRVSAGHLQEEVRQSHPVEGHLGYFGLGWEKSVDGRDHLGVSLELGAYFLDDRERQAVGNGDPVAFPEEQIKERDKPWRPVISLEVNYQF